MNKREVSEALGCSTRQVEKYVGAGRLHVVRYIHGKSGREGVYDESEVARLKAELEQKAQEVVSDAPLTALASRTSQGLAVAGQLAAMLDRQHEDAERIIAAVESLKVEAPAVNGHAGVSLTDKLTLTLKEAAELSGLSYKHLRAAIAEGELKGKVIGRGWRVKRPDLDAYVKKL